MICVVVSGLACATTFGGHSDWIIVTRHSLIAKIKKVFSLFTLSFWPTIAKARGFFEASVVVSRN